MVRKPEFRLQGKGQKERGKLPLGKYVRLALAATETVTISQERGSILPVQKNFFFPLYVSHGEFDLSFLHEWACIYSFNTNVWDQAKNGGYPAV